MACRDGGQRWVGWAGQPARPYSGYPGWHWCPWRTTSFCFCTQPSSTQTKLQAPSRVWTPPVYSWRLGVLCERYFRIFLKGLKAVGPYSSLVSHELDALVLSSQEERDHYPPPLLWCCRVPTNDPGLFGCWTYSKAYRLGSSHYSIFEIWLTLNVLWSWLTIGRINVNNLTLFSYIKENLTYTLYRTVSEHSSHDVPFQWELNNEALFSCVPWLYKVTLLV